MISQSPIRERTSARIAGSENDGNTTQANLLHVRIEAILVAGSGVVALRAIGDGVDPRSSGISLDVGNPARQIRIEVKVGHGPVLGLEVARSDTHDVLNVQRTFSRGVGGVIGALDGRSPPGGIRVVGVVLLDEGLQIRLPVVFSLEFSDGLLVVGVSRDDLSDVVVGAEIYTRIVSTKKVEYQKNKDMG